VYERADMQLSLSKLTFPHELIRVFITEQIYRALTIARNMPYHHD
ncbi:MAG: 23S rRNA (pseudouridine(1915)-N(3))-methyltransferase RlmH, partial [Muribaculaceae bacterium]|nr:23S rRNA (pseudouridine(1915)-N(3))-methyltransferase RlmH [Muribaculaceae bacterium]